jgi:hypothetical protein
MSPGLVLMLLLSQVQLVELTTDGKGIKYIIYFIEDGLQQHNMHRRPKLVAKPRPGFSA